MNTFEGLQLWFVAIALPVICALLIVSLPIIPREMNGEITSINKTDLGLCTQTINFYNNPLTIFCDEKINEALVEKNCLIKTKGFFLESIKCKEKEGV